MCVPDFFEKNVDRNFIWVYIKAKFNTSQKCIDKK